MYKSLLLVTLSFFACTFLSAQQFSGIYQESEAELKYRQVKGWDAFLADHTQQLAAGYRLTDLESNRVEGDSREYYGIYTQSNLKDSVGMALGWREFVRLKKMMTSNEYLMVDIHAFSLNENDVQFIGVWVKEELDHKVRLASSRENLDKEIQKLGRRRFKLKRVHVIDTPHGVPEYLALFHYSPSRTYNFLHYSADFPAFTKDKAERDMSGVRLIDYASFLEDGTRIYLGVYQNGDYDSQFSIKDSKTELDEAGKSLKEKKGLSLVNMNIY